MQTKLTLTIDKSIIKKAKSYAKKSNRSLSEIVATYLDRITSMTNDEPDADLDKLRGIIQLPEKFDEKEAIRSIRYNKHR